MAENASITAHPDLDQWVEVGADERITIHTGKVDIGQRISTALAIIAAEELDVAYDRIDVKRTETGVDPNEGMTAGSMSMQLSGNAVRLATATARRHLLSLAAKALEVEANSLEVADGLIQSRATNRSVTYWELLGGEDFGIPVDPEVIVKSPESHTQVGQRVIAQGMFDIVSGNMKYVHDMQLPGMLHARLIRPPHYHAKLKSLETGLAARLADADITLVQDGSFLAVAGADEYEVIKAALRVANAASWDMGEGLPTADLFTSLADNERESLPVRDGTPVEEAVPPLDSPPAGAAATLAAEFEKPYHMHGSLGPSAACAVFRDGKLDVWSHSQGIYPLRGALAEAFGMEATDIHISHTPGAGCYGHNGADDAAYDAALVAKAIPDTPILLKWSRDDEHAWEPYASAMLLKLRASLDDDGNIIDWNHETYADTFNMRPVPGRAGSAASKLVSTGLIADALPRPVAVPAIARHMGIHRNLDPLYTFPNRRLVKNLVRGLPLRTSALRTLGAFGNVVAIECFMNELAEVAKIDPAEFRLRHLDNPRAKEVIEVLAARMEADGAGTAEGLGQGIGFGQYKNIAAYAAVGVELEVNEAAEVRLHRVWISCDAGEVVDPDGLIAQMEGGFIQTASWALHEQVTWDHDGVTSRDWETYPIIRFDNIPKVEVMLMDRPGVPFLGAGEAVSGPGGAAIANAIYDAIGIRLRHMPFTPDTIRTVAML